MDTAECRVAKRLWFDLVREGKTDLLRQYANHCLNDVNEHNETALVMAVRERDVPTIRCLLNLKADANFVPSNGVSLLHVTSSSLWIPKCAQTFQELVMAGADLTALTPEMTDVDDKGLTLLHSVCIGIRNESTAFLQSTGAFALKALQILVLNGADINQQTMKQHKMATDYIWQPNTLHFVMNILLEAERARSDCLSLYRHKLQSSLYRMPTDLVAIIMSYATPLFLEMPSISSVRSLASGANNCQCVML